MLLLKLQGKFYRYFSKKCRAGPWVSGSIATMLPFLMTSGDIIPWLVSSAIWAVRQAVRAVRRAVRAVRLAVRAVRRAVRAVRRAVRAARRAVRAVRADRKTSFYNNEFLGKYLLVRRLNLV